MRGGPTSPGEAVTQPNLRELAAEIEVLQRKLDARKGQPGYLDNCAAIEARMAEVKALISGEEPKPEAD